MAAPRIIEDRGAFLLVEDAMGTQRVIPRAAYEAAVGKDESQAANHNVPNMEPAPTPDFQPNLNKLNAPPPVSPELDGSPQYQEQKEEIAPTIPAPEAEPDSLKPDAISGTPSPIAPPEKVEPAKPEPPPVSSKPATPEDYVTGVREYERAQQEIIKDGQSVDQRQADSILSELESQDKKVATIEEDALAAKQHAFKEGQKLYDEQKTRIDEYVNADVDQDRWWDNKSTGTKILGAISMALSGLGMAMKGQGGKNPALDIINSAIDRDLNIQMEKIQRMGTGVQMNKGLIADFWDMSDREQDVFNLAKATALSSTARKLDIIATKATSERVAIGARKLSEDLKFQSTTLLEGNRQQREVEINREYNSKTSRISVWNARQNAKESLAWQKEKFGLQQSAAGAGKGGVDGSWVLDSMTGKPIGQSVYGEKGAKELSDRQASYHKYRGLASDYEAALVTCKREYRGPGSDRIQTECRSKLDEIQLEMAIQKAIMNNPGGRISDADIEIARKQIKQGDSWSTSKNPLAAIRRQQTWADREIQGEFKRHGITGYDPSSYYGKSKENDDKLTENQKELQKASTPITKSGWVRDPSNKESTDKFQAMETLVIKASKGDREARRYLELIAGDPSHPDSKRAQEHLDRIDRDKELNKKEPGVTARNKDGSKIGEKNIDAEGNQTGSTLYNKDGSVMSVTEYWPGTTKMKSTTIYKGGKPAVKMNYSIEGKYLGKEQL